MLELLIKAFNNCNPLLLSDGKLIEYDEYIDFLIANKKIIKHSQYDFTGEGLAIMINDGLEKLSSNNKVVALRTNDSRIDTRVKGQGVYFLITNFEYDESIAILTWGSDAVTFWPPKT